MRSKVRALVAVRALVLAFVALGGCNSQQVEPPGTATESGDSGSSGAPETGTETGDTPTGGSEGPGSGSGESGESGGTTGAADCEGPEGCFDCKPTKSVELLNACGDASCEPFANTVDRLPLLKQDGTLPPLP